MKKTESVLAREQELLQQHFGDIAKDVYNTANRVKNPFVSDNDKQTEIKSLLKSWNQKN